MPPMSVMLFKNLLLEQLESSLLGLVAGLDEVLQRLLAERVLLLAHNPATLRLHQIRLDEATGGVLRRSVENLSLRSNRGSLGCLACLGHFLFNCIKKMRGVSVFYKTYGPDLKWLRYSLLSLKKFCKDPYKLIIAVEHSAEDAVHCILSHCKLDAHVVPIQYELSGYFEQQLAKLEAYKWCSNEVIVMMDSDALFKIPFSFTDFFTPDGKILWKICRPEDAGELFQIWKQAFENTTKQPYTIYTMCDNPYILTRTALQKAKETFEEIHSCSYREYVRGGKAKHDFSEYLWLGWWCKNYSKDHCMPIVSAKEAWDHPQIYQFISVGSFAEARPTLESIVNR